jgi:alpha-beta hydrolase superfamily lysophospholipase
MEQSRPAFLKRPLVKWALRLVGAVILIVATLVVGGGIQAVANVPDLQPWHRLAPAAEVHASDLDDAFTLEQYLSREEQMFAEVAERIEADARSANGAVANRYDPQSISSPRQGSRDWNRTFEMTPEAVRGGALLVHGLTDSPYSMRALAQVLNDAGFYALALRVPGHGTTPAALAEATAEDWMAAVRLGVRHVRQQIGPERPLVLVGYSNGGALVLRYALAATADAQLPPASRIILVSAMIGVNPLARIVRVISALGPLPFFEKARWLDVIPEYNPYKFNSFPASAAQQSYRMSSMLQAELAAAERADRTTALPPILTFQSVVDATVSTQAVVSNLYDRLPAGDHELVVFDINRLSGLEPFVRREDAGAVARLAGGAARLYRRTLVTNVATDTLEVRARTVAPGALGVTDEPLGLQWPAQMFSLSHVALPFRSDDVLYGTDLPLGEPARMVSLGRLSPRGEKAVLTVPIDTLMRVGWNPFFPFVARRVTEWVTRGASTSR